MKPLLLRYVFCAGLAVGGGSAHAGIPTLDALVAALQTLGLGEMADQIVNQLAQIANQGEQIRQGEAQVEAVTGNRGLGTIQNNPELQNYIPQDAMQTVSAIRSGGYSGLRGTAQARRDERMVYNCLDLEGEQRSRCQADLAMPYQEAGFLQDAFERSRARGPQIQSLMREIDATTDAKGVAEIQARLSAENAMVVHTQTQAQLMAALAAANARIEESRAREARLEQLSRTGRVGDFLR